MKCKDCPSSQVINDRDPDDWFCDDDEAITCTLVKNDVRNASSPHPFRRSEFKVISSGLRPHDTKNVEAPAWCPLAKGDRCTT